TTSPTRARFLLTRPGSIGRCVNSASQTCPIPSNCGAGEFCLGGHCTTDGDNSSSCATSATCAAGAACLGGKCRTAPACLGDDDCTGLLGPGYVCTARSVKWCRNAPNVACSSSADCPACPIVDGSSPAPCGRLCEARSLKLYVNPGAIASV